ncbi:MAG: hypothetical protein IJT33_04105 [Campylobacter sp.]|nr:hypothetical protein [Campylobacter sp.]MBQ7675626.1 hypothetical protein [Campylobacter sp.]MBQ9876643.1 hypothetical protein [Campylobacter sp.]MBR0072006.1 hypothetical protein [Campylobacter sp.]
MARSRFETSDSEVNPIKTAKPFIKSEFVNLKNAFRRCWIASLRSQ